MNVSEFIKSFNSVAAGCKMDLLTLKDTKDDYVSGHTYNSGLGFVIHKSGEKVDGITLIGNTASERILFTIAILIDIFLKQSIAERNKLMELLGLYDGRCLLGTELRRGGFRLKMMITKRAGVHFSITEEGEKHGVSRANSG